ncbi:MAG TPA: DUF916 domain-containing protein [Ilumatobacteraceae bacterium]|nr:DUF916 domain-containing protein [Ilumatobacteraceae bacterium]
MAVAVAALALPAPVSAQDDDVDPVSDRLTWGVAPSGPDGQGGERTWFEFRLDPGARHDDSLALTNYSYEDLTFDVYAKDAFTNASGGLDVLAATGQSRGAGTWIGVAPQVEVPARSTVDIPFTLQVPTGAEPGDHAAGIVASLTHEVVDGDGSRVTIDRRVGARVYVRVLGDVHPELTVERLDVGYRSTGGLGTRGDAEVAFRVTNTGNIRLGGVTELDVAGPFGMFSATQDGPNVHELLPGESFDSTAVITGLTPSGRLRATVTIDPEPADGAELSVEPAPDVASATTWAVPRPLIVLVGLAVGLLVLRRRIVRRRRRAPTEVNGDDSRDDDTRDGQVDDRDDHAESSAVAVQEHA